MIDGDDKMKKKVKADKPFKEREEAKDMASITAINKNEIVQISSAKEGVVIRRKKGRNKRLFKSRLVQKCKDDGMNGDEIREWMKEI